MLSTDAGGEATDGTGAVGNGTASLLTCLTCTTGYAITNLIYANTPAVTACAAAKACKKCATNVATCEMADSATTGVCTPTALVAACTLKALTCDSVATTA